jgi:hypothetical protein
MRCRAIFLLPMLAGALHLPVDWSWAQPAASSESLTNFLDFKRLCTAFVMGYEAKPERGPARQPVLGHFDGDCSSDRRPIVLSVTHENERNSHANAANYDKNIASYMSDLELDGDLGHWVDLRKGLQGDSIAMLVDTAHFTKVNVTGWPIQYGHMFAAFNDRLRDGATLDKDIVVEFEIRIGESSTGSAVYRGYSGNRIMVGAVGIWAEPPPRANRTHFFEMDLVQSGGYSASYGDPAYPLCQDIAYDRCFYDPQARYAEGREVRYASFLRQPPLPTNTNGWTHLRIPLSEAIRRLRWVAPPAQWEEGRISGLYIGVESQGAAVTAIEVRHYNVYTLTGGQPNP